MSTLTTWILQALERADPSAEMAWIGGNGAGSFGGGQGQNAVNDRFVLIGDGSYLTWHNGHRVEMFGVDGVRGSERL